MITQNFLAAGQSLVQRAATGLLARVYLHKPSNLNAFVLLGIGVLASKTDLNFVASLFPEYFPRNTSPPFPETGRPRQQWTKKTLEAFSPPAPFRILHWVPAPTQPGETSLRRRDRIIPPRHQWHQDVVYKSWFKMVWDASMISRHLEPHLL